MRTTRRRRCPLAAEKVAQCYRRFLTDMQSHSGALMYAALSSAIDDGGTLHVVTRRAGSAGYRTGTPRGVVNQVSVGFRDVQEAGCVRLQRGAEREARRGKRGVQGALGCGFLIPLSENPSRTRPSASLRDSPT